MVILLTAVLSAVAVNQFVDFSGDAKIATTKERLLELKMAISGDPRLVAGGAYVKPGFIADVGSVPTALDDLTAQGAYAVYNPFTKRGWRGPYISTTDPNWNKDSWGTVIQFNSASRTITSCGKNGTCRNADDISVSF